MKNTHAIDIYFQPDLTRTAAQSVARELGCALVWRGNRFVLFRVRPVPKRHARSAPVWVARRRSWYARF